MDSVLIPLYDRKGYVVAHTRVDAEDLEALSGHVWRLHQGYACRKSSGYAVLVHRLLLGAAEGEEVDHINGDGLDNRRGNLRLVTHAQNGQNLRLSGNNGSGYRGVSWESARQQWHASAQLNGCTVNLGRFATAAAAGEAAAAFRIAHMPFTNEARLVV